jgi:anti-sigma B factor antagonist
VPWRCPLSATSGDPQSPDSLAGVRDGDDRLTVDVQPGALPTLALTGEVDPHTAPLLEQELATLIDEGATAIRIDGSALTFIDSSGLRVLVDAHRRLGATQEALVLAGVSPTLRRLLEVTGLDEHFTVEPD